MDLNAELGQAVVLYQSSKQMKMAIDHLLGLTLFGRVLVLHQIHQNSNPIQLSCVSKDYKGFKDQRFKIPNSKNWKNINPASTTVHLSNLTENCSLAQVQTLFSTIATPLMITYFKDNASMALACFDSIDSAIRIITTFHNYDINGKFLKVAFAKYNLMVNQNQSNYYEHQQVTPPPGQFHQNQDYQTYEQNLGNFYMNQINGGNTNSPSKNSYNSDERMSFGFLGGFCGGGNQNFSNFSTEGSIKGFSGGAKSDFQLSGSSDDENLPGSESGREITLLSDLLKGCEVVEDADEVSERTDIGCSSDLKVQKMLDCLDM